MSGSAHQTQNPHFMAAASFFKSVLTKLAAKKSSVSDQKWCLEPPPEILSTAKLNVGACKQSPEKCRSLWDLRDPKNEAFSQACWNWFFTNAGQQSNIAVDSSAWHHLVQYASEYVFANIFHSLPDGFFEVDGGPKNKVREHADSSSSNTDKVVIESEMKNLMRELGLGFLEELNKQAVLDSKKKEFSYWNSLIAALSATILMALLTIVCADSALMMALLLTFHSAPVLCSAIFLIVFLVCELADYFVLTPFFSNPFEALKPKPESGPGAKRLLAFSHHGFLCGALLTLTALAMLGLASASPGVSILVALVPSAGVILAVGGPVLLAFIAFLSGVALIGFGYLCAMGWEWWRGSEQNQVKEGRLLDPVISFINADQIRRVSAVAPLNAEIYDNVPVLACLRRADSKVA